MMLADHPDFETFKMRHASAQDSDEVPELRDIKESFDVDRPQFRARHVCAAADVTFQTMMNWEDRGHLALAAAETETEGRREYPATDVVRVAVVKRLAEVGVPFPHANHLAQDAVTRLHNLINKGPGHDREHMLYIIGKVKNDWHAVPHYADGKSDEPEGIPAVSVLFQIDQLLEETISALWALAQIKPLIKTTSFAPTGYKGPRPDDEEN
jgi:DNA-binding transcriptional MerR regulator